MNSIDLSKIYPKVHLNQQNVNINIIDENEVDIDCGGDCKNCRIGNSCKKDDDCGSDYCLDGTCSEIIDDIDSDIIPENGQKSDDKSKFFNSSPLNELI